MQFGIKPQWVYRKSDPETRRILGLKPTAIDDGINDGTLPPPAPLTAHGKATGWMGWQLIEVQRKRLEAAAQRHAEEAPQRAAALARKENRRAAARVARSQKRKPAGRKRKSVGGKRKSAGRKR
jgi:hypothetical protein